jgi:hypothetical protein
MNGDLAWLKEHFAALTEALDTMAEAKRGSNWHLDRVRERMRVGRAIDRLEACVRDVTSHRDFWRRIEL